MKGTFLTPHGSVILIIGQNISIVPKLLKREKKRISERVLELVGLDPDQFINRYPTQLSGGQQQTGGSCQSASSRS